MFLKSGRTSLFSLKAANAPLLVWFCAGSNHLFHGKSSFRFPKEGGVERRRISKKQVEAGRWSTLISSVSVGGSTYSQLKHSDLSMTVLAW